MTLARLAFSLVLVCLAAACASAALPADPACAVALGTKPYPATALQALMVVQTKGEAAMPPATAKACVKTMDSAAADAQAVAERVKARAAGKPLPPSPPK